MARRRTKKRPPRRRGRKSGLSYRHGLKEAIAKWLPGQFFSQWPVCRGAKWSALRVFWMATVMAWSAEQTLQARVDATRDVLRALVPTWPLGTTSTGWYEAQLKWRGPLQPAVSQRRRRQIQALAGRHWLRAGWCAFAVDGSRVACPRTAANPSALGRAGKAKTGPQLFLTTLLHMGTGLPWDFRIGPGTASERRHLEDMLPSLPAHALVVADAGVTGYPLFRRLLAAEQNFLIRVGADVHLLRKLGYVEQEGPETVDLWPDKNRHQPPVVLRLLGRRQGKKRMDLVTTVLDKEALSERDAALLDEMRWGVEVLYRSLTQALQRRKMLSHSPEAARCELPWTMEGLWLLGLMSVAKILARGGDPLRWSAAAARDRVRASLRAALAGRQDRCLEADLGQAVQDAYVRHASKKARDWPHKNREKPPGPPKIQLASAGQRKAIKRLKTKSNAA